MDLPSIQTSTSYRAPSPGSPSSMHPALSLQHRSYSNSSLASLSSSTSSSSSDRHLSLSPVPLTPGDRSRLGDVHRPIMMMMLPKLPMLPLPSPQLSNNNNSSIMTKHQTTDPYDHHANKKGQLPQLPSFSPSSSSASSPRLPSLSSLSSSSSPSLSSPRQRHHPYHTSNNNSSYSYPPTPSSSSPRVYHSSPAEYHSYHNSHPHHYSTGGDYFCPRTSYHSQPFATPKEEEREPISPSFSTQQQQQQHRLRSSSSHSDMNDTYHSYQHYLHPKQEDRESFLRSIKATAAALPPTPHGSSPSLAFALRHSHSVLNATVDMEVDDDEEEDEESDDEDDERSSSLMSSLSRSRSASLTLMSEASASMTSLMSVSDSMYSGGSSPSPTPVPTSTTNQLLMCPVCSRAFKPSKNQNCNLRRHLKNVHNMSPTMHPRKCKWDSLPDGRVKDDKDRKERTRKSKRIWAQKFRQRRKVEEAAVVLSMLSQAV